MQEVPDDLLLQCNSEVWHTMDNLPTLTGHMTDVVHSNYREHSLLTAAK